MLDETPSGWEQTTFGECFDFKGGNQPPKETFLYEPAEGYVRLLQIRDFESDEKSAYIPVSASKGRCTKEDILIARYGASLGRILRGKEGAYNVALVKLIFQKPIDRNFAFYWLNSDSFQEPLFRVGSRSAQAGFNKSDLAPFPILLPPLLEQERIAKVLTSVDDSIRATEAVIAQAERVKRGLMEDLLTGGLGSDAIARGEVPEGWTATYAREIAIAKGLQTGPFGSQLKAAEYSESDSDELTCVVMPKDIVDGRINFDTCARIDYAKAETLSRHILRPGDVLFARRGDLSKVAVYDEPMTQAICGTGCLRLRADLDKTTYRFLRLVFTSHDAIQWLIANAVGATMLNLNTEIIGKLPLLMPSIEEQERIAGVMESLESHVRENRKTMAQLQIVKRGLMDDLLTGRVRTV